MIREKLGIEMIWWGGGSVEIKNVNEEERIGKRGLYGGVMSYGLGIGDVLEDVGVLVSTKGL